VKEAVKTDWLRCVAVFVSMLRRQRPELGVLHRPACRSPRQTSCPFGSHWCGYAARIPI